MVLQKTLGVPEIKFEQYHTLARCKLNQYDIMKNNKLLFGI